MTTDYDVVVIGGGHNGLVTAAYLAGKGRAVLVVESRDQLGGVAGTEEVFSGFLMDVGASHVGLLHRNIVRELRLKLKLIESPISLLSLGADDALRLWKDPAKAQNDIGRYSDEDSDRYHRFVRTIEKQAHILRSVMDEVPPTYGRDRSMGDIASIYPWGKVALRLRRSGRQAVTEFLRVLPMSVEQLLDEWFESELLKGSLATSGIAGTMQGPKASGTALMLLYQAVNGFPTSTLYIRGGTGALIEALANEVIARGGEIRTGTPVSRIVVQDYGVQGVVLSNGEEIRSTAIASSADPRTTLLELVGAPNLELRVVRSTRNIRFRGSTAKINFALSGIPDFINVSDEAELAGRILVSPSTEYMERAYDDAKYRRWSRDPILDMTLPTLLDPSRAPDGSHVLSAIVRYAPYQLENRTWDEAREEFADQMVDAIAKYAPDFPGLILNRQVLTPIDYERDYGLPEGSIYHGQMALDQVLTMRPIPGYGRYSAPVEGLYFCGAGSHPGGGVTGIPGRNAARIIHRSIG